MMESEKEARARVEESAEVSAWVEESAEVVCGGGRGLALPACPGYLPKSATQAMATAVAPLWGLVLAAVLTLGVVLH